MTHHSHNGEHATLCMQDESDVVTIFGGPCALRAVERLTRLLCDKGQFVKNARTDGDEILGFDIRPRSR